MHPANVSNSSCGSYSGVSSGPGSSASGTGSLGAGNGSSSSPSASSFTTMSSMYAEWATLNVVQICEQNRYSVLAKLQQMPQFDGQSVVQSVVKPLAQIYPKHHVSSSSLSSTSTLDAKVESQGTGGSPGAIELAASNNYLENDQDVLWVMDIICYGLSLPFYAPESCQTVERCTHIYCEWLSALTPGKAANKFIPRPVKQDPNRFARKIFQHLYNIFLPRQLVTSGSIGSPTVLPPYTGPVGNSATSPTSPAPSINSSGLSGVSLTGGSSFHQNLPSGREFSATPTPATVSDTIEKQALLCHRLLNMIEALVTDDSNILDAESWEQLLIFLLAISDVLVSPPPPASSETQLNIDDTERLGIRVLDALFKLWLVACRKCFPSPSLWKTFHTLCQSWRHRKSLIDHWNFVNLTLTFRMVSFNCKVDDQSSTSCYNLSGLASAYPRGQNENEDFYHSVPLIVQQMDKELVTQTWYRFLHLIGNPVQLCCPDIISKTEKFLHYSFQSNCVVDPRQHPCLAQLPRIFRSAMEGLAKCVDVFLGVNSALFMPHSVLHEEEQSMTLSQSARSSFSHEGQWLDPVQSRSKRVSAPPQSNPSPQSNRKSDGTAHFKPGIFPVRKQGTFSSKDQSNSKYMPHQSSLPTSAEILRSTTSPINLPYWFISHSNGFKLYANRPKVNSLLDIFGSWLFSASLLTTSSVGSLIETDSGAPSFGNQYDSEVARSGSTASFSSAEAAMMAAAEMAKVRKLSEQSASDRVIIESELTPENFEAGQAEAIGALCRIFCSKQTSEHSGSRDHRHPHGGGALKEIRREYLSRFYVCLVQGLALRESGSGAVSPSISTSILLNSTELFQVDLNGIHVLIPHFIRALELVLIPQSQRPKFKPPEGIPESKTFHVRRACIQILISLLCHPLHFNKTQIHDNLEGSSTFTFRNLRPRLINLLINSLQNEKNAINVQILLSGFLVAVHDIASYELENHPHGVPTDTSSGPPSSLSRSSDCSNDPSDHHHHQFVHSSDQGIPDTGIGLLANAITLVSSMLNKDEVNEIFTSVTALEVLESFARIKCIQMLGGQNCTSHPLLKQSKEVVKHVCDYITRQCQKPGRDHSRDLHSAIITAFKTLQVWFTEHPYLLKETDSVSLLLEVIELGISGRKSKGADGSKTIKSEKEPKPASMRVHEAAEALLFSLTANFAPNWSNDYSIDEAAIFQLLKLKNGAVKPKEASRYFKYYVNDCNSLLAVLDPTSVAGQEDSKMVKNSAIIILRSPFGKFLWRANFRPLPSSQSSSYNSVYMNPGQRPNVPSTPNAAPRLGHRSSGDTGHERTGLLPLDHAVTNVDHWIQNDSELKTEIDKTISRMTEHDEALKQSLSRCSSLLKSPNCGVPLPASPNEFESIRLLLKSIGLLSVDMAMIDDSGSRITMHNNNSISLIAALNQSDSDYVSMLKELDMISSRTSDTVFIYYVRRGLYQPQDIVDSICKGSCVSDDFIDLLKSLGTAVNAKSHPGWTGNLSTSWKVFPVEEEELQWNDYNPSLLNGIDWSLYWSDSAHEVAFILPSGKVATSATSLQDAQSSSGTGADSESLSSIDSNEHRQAPLSAQSTISAPTSRTSEADGDSHTSDASTAPVPAARFRSDSTRARRRPPLLANIGCDTKVLVVWLESCDDELHLPIQTLLQFSNIGAPTHDSPLSQLSSTSLPSSNSTLTSSTSTNEQYFMILIHPLECGLYRIMVRSSFEGNRHWSPPPLMNGMVVDKRIIGPLIRQTVLNFCSRRRRDDKNYRPPHAKRKDQIEDMVRKFKLQTTEPQLYASVFS